MDGGEVALAISANVVTGARLHRGRRGRGDVCDALSVKRLDAELGAFGIDRIPDLGETPQAAEDVAGDRVVVRVAGELEAAH